MRLFQNVSVDPDYTSRLHELTKDCESFQDSVERFLDDRYCASHILSPVLNKHPTAFLAIGDDEISQRRWAAENGLPRSASMANILLAQIEEHRTEVFYNLDPLRYNSQFVRRLPHHVKVSLAWRAAPSRGLDLGAYNAAVCNFPSILERYRQYGWQAEYFTPAHDPEMDVYATNTDRPIDVLFIGTYSRHHQRRAKILEAVSSLRNRFNLSFCLYRSRFTRLAESSFGNLLPIASYRRPAGIREVSREPVFGRNLYFMLSQAKIVLNGAVDMAGTDRGNMRCFEALGCGALMISDQGNYPSGMENGKTLLSYANANEAVNTIESSLADIKQLQGIAHRGHEMIRSEYSKNKQWLDFQRIVSQARR